MTEMPIGLLEQAFLRSVMKVDVVAVRHLNQKLAQSIVCSGHLTKGSSGPVSHNMARLEISGVAPFFREKFPSGYVARYIPIRIDGHGIDRRFNNRCGR